MIRWACVAAALGAAVATGREARGETNATVGLTVGGGAGGTAAGTRALFHLGARGGVLFGRARDGDAGVGLYADAGTVRFDAVDLGAGCEVLLPITEHVPVVLSVGPAARHAAGWSGGVAGGAFVGSRSHNFHGAYGMAVGLFAQPRFWFEGGGRAEVVVGAQVDALVLALPVLLGLNALR